MNSHFSLFFCFFLRVQVSVSISWDFETGELIGWTTTGTAFDYQPTYGDNSGVRNRPSQHEGNFWIGTYEQYQGPNTGNNPGNEQGDTPTGTMTSGLFYNTADYLRFLIGGGNNIDHTYVELQLSNGTSVKRATGVNSESMEYVVWDIRDFRNTNMRVVIADLATGGWGHINCDDFQFIGRDFEGRIWDFTNDFETGDLRGWRVTGEAFQNQPTFGDNPTARSRGQPSEHEGDFWIGGYENYQGSGSGNLPGDYQGDGPQGKMESELFLVQCQYIHFLIGGGNDMDNVYVELVLLDGRIVKRATGLNTETMARVFWDISHLYGEIAQLRIVDKDSGGWGHINCDDFNFFCLENN